MKQKTLSLMLSLILLVGILIPAAGQNPGFSVLPFAASAEGVESDTASDDSESKELDDSFVSIDPSLAAETATDSAANVATSPAGEASDSIGPDGPASESKGTAEEVETSESAEPDSPAGSTDSPEGGAGDGAENPEKKNEPETEVSDPADPDNLSEDDDPASKQSEQTADSSSITLPSSDESKADERAANSTSSNPIVPTDLELTSENLTSITLTFSGTTSTLYQVYRSTKKTSGYIPLGYAWEPFSGSGEYSFEDSNAVKGILYYYKVRWESGSSASAQTGDFSKYISGRTHPAAPQKVTGTATATKVITLSWPFQEGVGGYQVQRSTNYESGYKTLSSTVSKKAVSYQDKTVKPGMQYYYRVRAYYSKSGTKYYSPWTVSSVILSEPVPPENFTVTASTETSVTLSWTPLANVKSYMLDWSYTADGERIRGSVSGIAQKKKTYQVTNLKPGAKVTFQIRSVLINSSGAEMRSGVSQLVYTLPTASTETTFSSATASQSITSVGLFSENELGAENTENAENGDEETSEEEEPLPVSDDPEDLIEKGDMPETSEDLIEKSSLTEAPVISSAVYIPVTQENPGVHLSWESVSGASCYRVYRSEKKNTMGTLLADQVTEIEYVDAGAKYKSGYFYRVAAVDADGQELSSKPYGFYAVPAMQLTVKQSSSGYYTLNWEARSNAERYTLYRSVNGGEFKAVKTITATSNRTYTDTSVKGGSTYTYAVSAFRTIDGVMTAGTPGVPFTCYMGVTENPNITVTQDPSLITLTWDPVTDASGYVISGAVGDGDLKDLATAGKSTTSWSQVAPAASGYITYYVRAYYKLGSTKYFAPDSDPVTVLRLAPPQLRLCRGTDPDTIDVAWSSVIGADRYLVYYKQSGETSYECLETDALSAVIPATGGIATSVYVRAAAEDHETTVLGSRSAIRVLTPYWKFALLIGNNKYTAKSSMIQLAATAADVAGVSVILDRQNGWNIKTCANMTGPEILSQISSFLSQADENSTCLFYYSGHGTQGYNDETGSLCGIDGSYVTPAELKAALDQLPGKSIILMDSCGSGALVENDSGAPTLDGDQYSVIAASAAYQSSYSSRFYSYFTYYLSFGTGWDYYTRQALSSVPADTNKDGIVTLQEITNYVLRYLTLSTVTSHLPDPSLPLVSP